MSRYKFLKTIVKNELLDNETIFITTQGRINDENNDEWWKMYEYTLDDLFSFFTGKEPVIRFWHEDGLCIILK